MWKKFQQCFHDKVKKITFFFFARIQYDDIRYFRDYHVTSANFGDQSFRIFIIN